MEIAEKRARTCCFTGHRQIPPEERAELAGRLERTVASLYRRGVRYFGAGGALGFDTLAAQTVLRLREDCPGMRLILVLPCPDQARGWRAEDAAEYERIRSRADKVVYTAGRYTPGCMHRRNRHLVDHSGVCVCYLTRDGGGTAYTVRYAGEQGPAVINIARGRTRVPRETGAENHPACRIPPANGVILTVPDPLFSYADHASASPVIRRR